MTMPLVSSVSPDASTTTSSAEAIVRMKPRFLAVPDDKQAAMNVDLTTVGTRMLAHAARIESLVPQAEATFKDFDPTPFREVSLWAMGLLQAHSQHQTATAPAVDPLPPLGERVAQKRVQMLDAAQYLVRQGHIDPARLTTIKGLVGYRNQASDMMGLSNVFRQSWGTVAGKSAVTMADVDEAASMADEIFVALAARETKEREVSEAAVLRLKAYSFVFHQYNAIRRVVSYLRWDEDDADDFAPSLFAGRGGNHRGKDKEGVDDSSATPAQESAGKAPPVTGGATAGGKAVAPVAGGVPGGSPFLDAPHVPGQPGGSPFIR